MNKHSYEELTINTLRALAIDMTNQANSGHPGLPLGAAPIGYKIFEDLKINPAKPNWFNRDRFVLAAGHGSALLYGLLHLSGFNLSLEELKNFRQLGSTTPGHPEFGETYGVDATTGPLGQGIPMALGMALAEKVLATKYNEEDFNVVDHYTYALCGDGDLQEGVSFEASSLAGHWGLGKLIVFFDSNDITLDGELNESSSDCIKQRYESMNWQYLYVEDGNDLNALDKALAMAKLEDSKPTLIEVKTTIGYGSINQGTSKVHGAPLGKEDGDNVKKFLNYPLKEFYIKQEVYDSFTYHKIKTGEKTYKNWIKLLKDYEMVYPKKAEEFKKVINDEIKVDFSDFEINENHNNQATRNSSNDLINHIAKQHPTFMGGSADLSGSNMTLIKDSGLFRKNDYLQKNINYGIREFAMSAINNGVMLHGGIKIFSSTFFIFSDYLKASVKLAALMKLPTIYVFTHDSVAVGEDGPTHQPIEQLAMFRAMPNVNVLRPCDIKETIAAWKIALESKTTPTIIVLSRQKLQIVQESDQEQVNKGAYIVKKESDSLNTLLIATGSEVALAISIANKLESNNIATRVVSMPSMNLFELQSKKYQNSIIPSKVKNRFVIEMASSFGWFKYTLKDQNIFAIDTYGASGPGDLVMKEYGFDSDIIFDKIKNIVK